MKLMFSQKKSSRRSKSQLDAVGTGNCLAPTLTFQSYLGETIPAKYASVLGWWLRVPESLAELITVDTSKCLPGIQHTETGFTHRKS
jgi:hypothetical protein